MKRERLERIKGSNLYNPAKQTAARIADGMWSGGFPQSIDGEIGYFFGFSNRTYSEVLRELSHTKVFSCKTSSIPLAEFWQPANLDKIKKVFASHLPDFDPTTALKYFEFPTEAVFNGRRIGDPSMTDIMIIAPGIQMAIEGKFTEYVEYKCQTIRGWLAKKVAEADETWTPASRKRYLRKILKTWFGYIHEAGCTGLADDDAFFRDCMDVSYQFLHRTASACCKADVVKGTTPVLVYQLFFEADNTEHIEKMEEFKADLRRWAETLKLRNMKFLIVSVPITNVPEVERRFPNEHGGIFTHMRKEAIYKFDFDGMTVESFI